MEQGITTALAMKDTTLFLLGKEATASFFIITYSNHGKTTSVDSTDNRNANNKYNDAAMFFVLISFV